MPTLNPELQWAPTDQDGKRTGEFQRISPEAARHLLLEHISEPKLSRGMICKENSSGDKEYKLWPSNEDWVKTEDEATNQSFVNWEKIF